MVLKTKNAEATFVTLKGIVKSGSPDGAPLNNVLIKSSSGSHAYTKPNGRFNIEIDVDEDGIFALCAVAPGHLVWIDWGHLDPETMQHGLRIYLTQGTVEAKVSGPGCCSGQVTRCATSNGIKAKVRLDAKPWTNTDASGNFGPLCTTAGWRTLWAKTSTLGTTSIDVLLPLGDTGTGNIICL